MHLRTVVLASLLAVGALISPQAEAPATPVPLWSGKAPGETKALDPEKDISKPGEGLVAGKPLIRLGNISEPTLQVFRPPAHLDNGSAVVVCPGGGYHILALDLEGTEVCEWLNSIGVTGILLKYRVPKREGRPPHEAPLQDVQRALHLTRHHAADWGIRPDRIGVLGFSAGGHLAALASTRFASAAYPASDAADAVSCRPDFSILIYPAYLTDKDQEDRISPDLPVGTNTPPTFLSISQDDPVRVETVLGYAAGLQRHRVPMEVHVFPTGGHGYGLRRTENPVTHWPDRATEWLRSNGWLNR
ncbi:MAG: alpha/beta hydrolase [Verrucomicrobiae bacterium]|nr:alpha/beta hydrolase [Verrucomicrobiae bacterium]